MSLETHIPYIYSKYIGDAVAVLVLVLVLVVPQGGKFGAASLSLLFYFVGEAS